MLTKIVTDSASDPTLRLESMSALAALVTREHVDLLLDLVSHSVPGVRGGALQALARVDPDTFLTALAGLDADRDWTVRVAVANALGTLPSAQSPPRLTVMLQDSDQKVIPAVLGALASSKATGVERVLLDRLGNQDLSVRAAAANALADLKVAAAGAAADRGLSPCHVRRQLHRAGRGARGTGSSGPGRCDTGAARGAEGS